jgi:hypothetical protein
MKRFPFYPLFIGLFSLLGVYASNPLEAFASELVTPILILTGFTVVLFILTTLFTRNIHRSALIVAAIVFCFMTYGYWVGMLWSIHPDQRLRLGYRYTVLFVQLIALVFVGFVAVRRVKDPRSHTAGLNWFSCALLACPLLIVTTRGVHSTLAPESQSTQKSESRVIVPLDPKADRPDIYFIILDAHGRRDILKDEYGYDDGPFLQHLRDKGFYVADQSTSNYMWTELSLPSALNMRYLDDLKGKDDERWKQAGELLHNSALVAELKTVGYRTIAFEFLENYLSLDNADLYFKISGHVGITPLQQLILDTSILSQFGGNSIKSRLVLDRFHLKREMFLFKLAQMPRVVTLPGPKFVYLHLYEPHTPFVFAADGSDPASRGYGSMFDGLNADVTDQQYHDWYREQAMYTDQRVSGMIDMVLARSSKPPVIVLIGDHGPRSGMRADIDESNLPECLSNLTAVYLPGKKSAGLYSQITPVNLFRVVLNDYFNAKLPMLEERSYYSYPTPFALEDVTADVRSVPSPSTVPASATRPTGATSRSK